MTVRNKILLSILFLSSIAFSHEGQWCEWKFHDKEHPDLQMKEGWLTPAEMAETFFPDQKKIQMVGYECWPERPENYRNVSSRKRIK